MYPGRGSCSEEGSNAYNSTAPGSGRVTVIVLSCTVLYRVRYCQRDDGGRDDDATVIAAADDMMMADDTKPSSSRTRRVLRSMDARSAG